MLCEVSVTLPNLQACRAKLHMLVWHASEIYCVQVDEGSLRDSRASVYNMWSKLSNVGAPFKALCTTNSCCIV